MKLFRLNKTLLMLTLVFIFNFETALAREAPWVGVDLKGYACKGSDTNNWYGPYDLTFPSQKQKIKIVEQHHFTPNVENHIKGKSASIPGDLNYTLMAAPNHHRALLSISRYQIKLDKKMLVVKNHVKPLSTPVECYFQRAIYFSPSDAAPYSLYAFYLKKIGESKKAKEQYQLALKVSPENSKIEYSYSLLLIDLKQYDDALKFAKQAYEHGNPPKGLRKKLQRLNLWEK